MGWLDNLYQRGAQAKQQSEPEARPVAPRIPRPRPKLERVWIQTAAPRDSGDPGAAEIGYYTVQDGILTMRDENGKATGLSQELRPGDDPKRVAGRLARAAWAQEASKSDFNRPLHYQPFGMV